MSDYLVGSDVLGVDEGPFVTIRVKDVPGLVRAKGGNVGSFIQSLAPQTIAAKVYGDMAAKIQAGLKNEGVDAEVKVVSVPLKGRPLPRDFYTGVALGGGAVGFAWLIKTLFGRGR